MTMMMTTRVGRSFALVCLFVTCITGAPLAPTTSDGATPITAKVSAVDFGSDISDGEYNNNGANGAIVTRSQAEVAEEKSDASEGAFKISLLPTSEKFAESVNLEHEGIPSKVLTVYDNSQKKLTDITHPVPILDSIGEHEKYGNNGDMFDGISRSIVNGYEAFSNLLNTFITKPKELARSISKGITAQLDILGGKIVGL